MKLTGISVGNVYPQDQRTWEQFLESDAAKTSLGTLLIALIQETAWSSEYSVNATITNTDAHLVIRHPVFLSDQALLLHDKPETGWTITQVEASVREHLLNSRRTIESAVIFLNTKATDFQRTLDEIDWGKARAIITKAFPMAAKAEPILFNSKEFYAFGLPGLQDPIFVTRKVGGEFVGGSALLNISRTGWFSARDGECAGQKHHLFWLALAREFAASELQIPSDDLYSGALRAQEKSFESQDRDRFFVEEAILHTSNDIITVIFDNNLPSKAFVNNQ